MLADLRKKKSCISNPAWMLDCLGIRFLYSKSDVQCHLYIEEDKSDNNMIFGTESISLWILFGFSPESFKLFEF